MAKYDIEKKIEDFVRSVKAPTGEILSFPDVADKNVYNPAPLQNEEGLILAGRVESRDNATDSKVMFFCEEESGVMQLIKNAPIFELEDPFFTKIAGEIIFGGVQVHWDITNPQKPRAIAIRTIFYRGKDIFSLNQFAVIEGMKDVRLVELADKRIAVFTRPQGGKAGKGKIGLTIIDTLENLTQKAVDTAPLIELNLPQNYWVGSNALYLLPNEKIGALGHIATLGTGNARHYYAMTFVYDVKVKIASDIKIIAARGNFPETEAKTPLLRDVVFPGGFIRGTTFYAGLSDARVGRTNIPRPFSV
jgi:hypothetical protein